MPYLGARPTDVFADRDLNGQEFILDADADTSITSDTDDQIDLKVGGTDVLTLTYLMVMLKITISALMIPMMI